MIRLSHINENGKRCFIIRPVTGTYTEAIELCVNGYHLYAGYSGYTWRWYVFDEKGKEVASVSNDYFEKLFRCNQTGILKTVQGVQA